MIGSVPLCMEQYKHMIGEHKLHGLKIDSYSYSPASRHIIVMHAVVFTRYPCTMPGEEPVSVQIYINVPTETSTGAWDC